MGKLETAQLERLREIGAYLAGIREDQSLSLEEIASHTYIPLRILRAIEAGDEHVLPEPVFVQGFIRRYADALGLDGKAIAQEFPIYVQPLQSDCIDEEPLVNQPAPWQFPSLKFFNSSAPGSVSQSPNWSLIAAAAVGAIALGGIIYALGYSLFQPGRTVQSALLTAEPDSSPESNASTEPDPTSEAAPVAEDAEDSVEEPAAEAITVPAVQSVSTLLLAPGTVVVDELAQATSAPVEVEVTLSRRSWIQVTIDGASDFEGIMDEGTTQTWRGEESITVLAGDAGAVSLAANGSEPKVMGENGGIAEVTITPENE